jgi:hypothetical protein
LYGRNSLPPPRLWQRNAPLLCPNSLQVKCDSLLCAQSSNGPQLRNRGEQPSSVPSRHKSGKIGIDEHPILGY